MRKLSNYVWLFAIALSAAFTMTACSEKNDGPTVDDEKGKVVITPANVFVNGEPKSIGSYEIKKNSKGQVVFISSKEEKEDISFVYENNALDSKGKPNIVMTVNDDGDQTQYKLFLNQNGFVKRCDEVEHKKNNTSKTKVWNFDYNSDGQLTTAIQSEGGNKITFTIIYKDGNAVETSTMSQKEGKEIKHYKIFYTSEKVTSPIYNKGCLTAYYEGLNLGLGDLDWAYYAGVLGKASKHLPIYNVDINENTTTFDWTISGNGFPSMVVIQYEGGKKEDKKIVW